MIPTAIWNDCVDVRPLMSVTVSAKVYVPTVVGVPSSVRPESDIPGGRLPDATTTEYGDVPPDIVRAVLNNCPKRQ